MTTTQHMLDKLVAYVDAKIEEVRAQQRAVDHGAAVWETDQKTGKVTFRWKDEIKQ